MKKETIKVVSLFSGIGGFEEGLKSTKIDFEIVFASEIDENAKKSYAANWGNKNLHGDITKINEKDVPEHQLLVAGFPCQSFSIAGMQKGFDDIRGTLFFDVARILKEKKPKYILLENVKNLISHDKSKTIRKILETLNELGYTVDFTIINSVEAGVPQNRDRTYICGILNYKAEKYVFDFRSPKVSSLKEELNKTEYKGFNFFNQVIFKNKCQTINMILENDVEEKYFFSSDKMKDYLSIIDIPQVSLSQNKIIKVLDIPREVHNDLERQRRVYSINGISPTVLARSDSTKILVETSDGYKIRKVTPSENFYIQGFSKPFVKKIKAVGMSPTQMYKQSGNAVSPPVITGILDNLYDNYMNK